MMTRDEHVARIKVQLHAMNARLCQLEERAIEAREDVHDSFRQQTAELRRQSLHAMAKLQALRCAGEDAWDGMVGDADSVLDAYKKSFRDFKLHH